MKARIAVLIMAFFLTGCAALSGAYEEPELTLVNIAGAEGGNLEQRFLLRFRLLNPNSVSLPVRGVRFRVDLLGETFATGATGQDFDIAAFSDAEFEVEVSVSLLRTARVIMAAMEQGPETLAYRLDARIATRLPLLGGVRVVREGVVDFGGLGAP